VILKAIGFGLVGIAAIAFAYVVTKLMLLFRSSASVGFDVPASGGRGASGSFFGVLRWWLVHG
jgi:hypothetical protein